MRTLCSVVLAFEALVIALVVPVAVQVAGLPAGLAGGLWGGLAAAALLLACVQRHRWGFHAGSVLQAVFVLSGFLVPSLLVLGVVFAGLWIAGIYVGGRTEALVAARERADGVGPANR